MRREWPTDIGPVDLMCRDEGEGWVAVEVKRMATIEAVEQLGRYLERIRARSGARRLPRRPGRPALPAAGGHARRVARDPLRRGRPRAPARRAGARAHPVRVWLVSARQRGGRRARGAGHAARAVLRPRLRLRDHAGHGSSRTTRPGTGSLDGMLVLAAIWWAWAAYAWLTNLVDPEEGCGTPRDVRRDGGDARRLARGPGCVRRRGACCFGVAYLVVRVLHIASTCWRRAATTCWPPSCG